MFSFILEPMTKPTLADLRFCKTELGQEISIKNKTKFTNPQITPK